MPKDRRADRTSDEADREHGERLQRAGLVVIARIAAGFLGLGPDVGTLGSGRVLTRAGFSVMLGGMIEPNDA